MAAGLIYLSRLTKLPLLDADGTTIGKITDCVLGPAMPGEAPLVIGFVTAMQRRNIFVNAGRVADVDVSGVRLQSGTIDLRSFRLRPGEMLGGSLLNRRVGGEVVDDVGLRAVERRSRTWEVATLAMGSSAAVRRRRAARIARWDEVPSLFDVAPQYKEIAALRELHPSDVARRVALLPPERRRELAEAMDDERLADLLEELPEEEQLRLIEGLDLQRVAHILEEMAPDDAADLLGEMSEAEQRRVLAAMDADEAGPLRRLLLYDDDSAGGLMTPEPIVLAPDATVAEALARMRDPEIPAAIAAQVFVARPPIATPTGEFLGAIGFQRLLREPPGMHVEHCLEDQQVVIEPDLSEIAVAEQLASYNLLAVAVCDGERRLLGAVTVDDVLDRTLPVGWRQR